MSEITVRVLSEEDWQQYRAVRLDALRDSPNAFPVTYEEEAAGDEASWRARMRRSWRFLADKGGEVVGVVSLRRDEDDPESGDIFGLYVRPQDRTTGVSWQLVQAAADRAKAEGYRRILYWVGSENARAIAFAANFGFRPAGERRPARIENADYGDQEVAMTLSLLADPGSVPNPNRGRVTAVDGPLR